MQRSRRRKLARLQHLKDRSEFPPEATFWAVDASLLPTNGSAALAAVPCTRGGDVDGPALALRPASTTRHINHVELLASLIAHTKARADGEAHPLVYTDSLISLDLLDQIRNGQPPADLMPELGDLAEALGPELHTAHLYALPRRTTKAMRYADSVAYIRHHIDPDHVPNPPVGTRRAEWAGLNMDQVLSAARALR